MHKLCKWLYLCRFAVMPELLKPTSDKIGEIQEFREKNRRSTHFNHLSGISESIPALGWVAVVKLFSAPKLYCQNYFLLSRNESRWFLSFYSILAPVRLLVGCYLWENMRTDFWYQWIGITFYYLIDILHSYLSPALHQSAKGTKLLHLSLTSR